MTGPQLRRYRPAKRMPPTPSRPRRTERDSDRLEIRTYELGDDGIERLVQKVRLAPEGAEIHPRAVRLPSMGGTGRYNQRKIA